MQQREHDLAGSTQSEKLKPAETRTFLESLLRADDSIKREEQESNALSGPALIPSELHILVTAADTNGYEISKLSDFMGQEIGGRCMSAIELMHDNYHYSKETTDCWCRVSLYQNYQPLPT